MLSTYKDTLTKAQARKELLESQVDETTKLVTKLKTKVESVTKARLVIIEVATKTQDMLKAYIEEMVTSAIQSVYPDPIQFVVKFGMKRNQSECELGVKDEGEDDAMMYKPQTETGGGLLDVISFALRIVFWSLQNPKSDNVIVLDEPFKFLGDEALYLKKAGKLVKEISSRLGIQFIIITHEEGLKVIADKFFSVKMVKKESIVTEEGTNGIRTTN